MGQFNETPYGIATFIEQLEPEEPFITIAVIGNFFIVPGEVCEALPKEAQAQPQKACFYADKIGNSRLCDGDMSTFKPRADCLFVGEAHAPEGAPVSFLEVEFGVGSMRKKLNVFGDRHWARQPDGAFAISQPEPFAKMPIRNELAHGGLQSEHNKHGIGHGDPEKTKGQPLAVANIVAAGRQAVHWSEDETPAGLGVLPTDLGVRAKLRGTFDGEWLYRRKPFPPKDFNPAFFNGARPDQQVDGYLKGNEELLLRNLHPTHAEVRARLPGTKVRIFVHHIEDHDGPVLEEVHTVLDTCLVNMYDETVRLTWRGTLASGPSKDLKQIPNLMVVEEPVDDPIDQKVYFKQFRQRIQAAKPKPPKPTKLSKEQQEKIDAINSKAIADMVKALKDGGADESLIAEVAKQETAEKAVDVLTNVATEMQEKLGDPPV